MNKTIHDMQVARDWCEAVIEFLWKVEPHHPMYGHALDMVRRTAKSDDSTAMKALAREIRGWTEALSTRQRDELNAQLAAKFGVQPDVESRSDSDQIAAARVALRGKIRNPEEYAILERRAECVFQENPESAELETINRLLAAFHAQS